MKPLYIFARLEPQSGKEAELRSVIGAVLEPTRAEAGCLRINLYESIHEAPCFFIHSKWVDETAFELHAEFPHTKRFVDAVGGLMTHPLQPIRTHEIG